MANFIVEHNCIYTDILPSENSIYVSYNTRMGVTAVQESESFRDLYMNNLALNPMFEDASAHKFQDDLAPTTSGDPSAAPVSATQISLTWTASVDNVGVDFYNIFRCPGNCTPTSVIGTTAQTSYTDTNLTPSTQYTYQLSAVDTSGNVSSRTTAFTGTTNASGPDGDDGGDDDGDSDGSSISCFISTSLQHK